MNENEAAKTPEEILLQLLKDNLKETGEERTKATQTRMEAKARQGYLMTKPPLGYERTDTKGLYSPNGLGEVMGVIFVALADSVINAATANELLVRFTHIYSGTKPSVAQVSKLYLNPYYAGYVSFKGKLYKGLHVPVITKEQYEKLFDTLNFSPKFKKN